ncbi:hypothetical protein PUN28_016859 [Cardiocondyla obscurior]|uniref:Uncharacterized protein n=1 Tax=Cardiocondyla obscurior TaxID=286306 RepID=A0AAW2ER73_9HYME
MQTAVNYSRRTHSLSREMRGRNVEMKREVEIERERERETTDALLSRSIWEQSLTSLTRIFAFAGCLSTAETKLCTILLVLILLSEIFPWLRDARHEVGDDDEMRSRAFVSKRTFLMARRLERDKKHVLKSPHLQDWDLRQICKNKKKKKRREGPELLRLILIRFAVPIQVTSCTKRTRKLQRYA